MRIRLLLRKQAGATIVEVLVAIALMGVIMPALATGLVASHAGRATSIQKLQATSLLREATEAVRNVHEKGWSNVATDGTYHPAISGTSWALVSGSESINGFTRQIVISSVQRDSSGTIVASGGTTDPSTKHVVVTVAWTKPIGASIFSESYLSRWQNDTTWTQTTQADFTGGTLTNTCATSTCDQASPPSNAVQLADLPATWQLPSVIGTKAITGNVAGNCVFVATISSVPYAFVGYASGMAIFNVSNPASPTLTGTFSPGGGVNDIYVSGTVAYLATTINNSEIITVNVANPAAPVQDDSLNLGDTGDARSIYVAGGFAYVGKQASSLLNGEFFIVNVSTPTVISQTGALNRQNADINDIYVNGNFAYIATTKTNAQFMIINVTTKNSPSISSSVNLGVTATAVKANGNTVYIGTQNNASAGELRIYNATTPTAPTSINSYEVGGNVNGVNLDLSNASYLILATAVATKQAIILNVGSVTTISPPTLVSTVNNGSTLTRVYIVGAYAYFASTNTTQGLTIVYDGYRPSGTFESSTFNAGANVGFNYLSFTATVPSGTTLTFQVAANSNNSTWNYVGPDGTAGTSYNAATVIGGAIPLVIVSNQYFRYKATFTPTSNGQQTPVINDISLNYSP